MARILIQRRPAVFQSALSLSDIDSLTAAEARAVASVVSSRDTGSMAEGSTVSSSATGWRANEPVGYTTRIDNNLSTPASGSCYFDSGSSNVVTDATAPVSPSNVQRANYPGGYGSGSGPFDLQFQMPGSQRKIYYALATKHSSNWYGDASAVNKMGFVWIDSFPAVIFDAQCVGNGTMTLCAHLQGVADAREVLQPNVGDGTMTRGSWHICEMVILIGNGANGTIKWWLDGVLVGNYTDCNIGSSSAAFPFVDIFPIWGGNSGSVPSTQTLDFDHWYVSSST